MRYSFYAAALSLVGLICAAPTAYAKLRCVNDQARDIDLKGFMIDEETGRFVVADTHGTEHAGFVTARSRLPGDRWRYHMEVAIPDSNVYAGQFGDLVEFVALPGGTGTTYRVSWALYAKIDGDRRLVGVRPSTEWRCVQDGYVS